MTARWPIAQTALASRKSRSTTSYAVRTRGAGSVRPLFGPVLVFRQGDCTKADFTDLANEPIVDEDEPSYPSVIIAGIQGIAPKSKARTEASGIDLASLWQTARGAVAKLSAPFSSMLHLQMVHVTDSNQPPSQSEHLSLVS